MSADIIQFPPRAPSLKRRSCETFTVEIMREFPAWLVVCGDFGWLHGSRREALADAREIAAGWGVGIVVRLRA